MWFPQKMKKLDVVIIKKFADAVSGEILKFGNFEIMELSGARVENYALKKAPLDETIMRFHEYKRRLINILTFFGNEIKPVELKSNQFMDEIDVKNVLHEIEAKIARYQKDMEFLKKRQNDIQIKLNSLSFFGNLDMDISHTKDIKHFYMGFGSIPNTNYQGFVDAISTLPAVVMNVGSVSNNRMVFFTVPNNSKDQVDKILENVYYKDYGIPQDVKGSIKSNIVKYGFEMSMTHDEEIWLDEMFVKMAKKYRETFVQMEQSIEYYLSMSRLKGEMAATNSVFLFSGWVPSDDVKILQKKVEDVTENHCLFLEEDAKKVMEEQDVLPPTKLKNPKVLKPFETLVNMFGAPNYNELDPTPIAAFVYIFMFGAMFGDIGQGFALSLLGGLLMTIKKLKKFRAIAQIILWAGVSAMIFGFLYGSVFGNEHVIQALWMNPQENIMDILIVSVGFGVIIISLGIILNIFNSFRRKDYGKMLFTAGGIAGIAFYWSLIYIAYTMYSGGTINPLLWIIPGISGIVIFLGKRLDYAIFHKGEKEPIALGIFELFEASLSLLSNTISFLRVGAFALNHGALMSAVFILAGMSKGPVGKFIALLIGNLFVIGFEGLVVGIQALRLEYYEFFVKFFRADGRKFEAMDIYKRE